MKKREKFAKSADDAVLALSIQEPEDVVLWTAVLPTASQGVRIGPRVHVALHGRRIRTHPQKNVTHISIRKFAFQLSRLPTRQFEADCQACNFDVWKNAAALLTALYAAVVMGHMVAPVDGI